MAEEDFDEEEVWAVVKERRDVGSPRGIGVAARDPGPPSAAAPSRRLPTGSRMIPRSNAEGRGGRQSAPVHVPDWSRIQKQKGDEEGEDDEEVVPPHEWITKKLARTQISSSSVCEGAGRTLKGRDLSKVRNAVLTRTGFLE